METLEKYMRWGIKNGMNEEELELFEKKDLIKEMGPVECEGALLCRTDMAVDFRAMTQKIGDYAEHAGVHFLFGKKVAKITNKKDYVEVYVKDRQEPITTSLLINCAGGDAVDIAHQCGLGLEYTDFHFRGDYWRVNPEFGKMFRHNIYTVPKFTKFQFLDPHLIIKVDDIYEIGPSAVPVAGPENYDDLGLSSAIPKLFERPVMNKLKLLKNPEFLKLAINELTHMSKEGMIRRANEFMPSLKPEHIIGKGQSGIRHSLIEPNGSFVPEAVELSDSSSYHILNYNSPGASGSIAFSACMVSKMIEQGLTDHLKRIPQRTGMFNFEEIVNQF